MKRQKTEEPKALGSPYMAARREWNERYGEYLQQAKTWRVVAFASLAATLLSIGGLVAVAMQSKVVPYAVEIDGHGDITRVARADVLRKPNANVLRAAMRNWIIGARTVYTDRQAMKPLIAATYTMTLPDSSAYHDLADYDRANNPYQRAANETVSVQVNVVNPISPNSWEVDWTETTKQVSGKVVSTKDWQAILTVSLIQPTTEQQIMLNPAGVYVRQFSWTSRLPSN